MSSLIINHNPLSTAPINMSGDVKHLKVVGDRFCQSGIYKLYWINCDYYYYGQALNLEKRKKEHLYALRKIKKKRLVLNAETGIYYTSITEASESSNINKSTFKNIMCGILKNKTSYILV